MLRALVVEDEIVVSLHLREGLIDEGFDVVVCNDAETALEWLSTTAPDIAIFDIALPGMSGDELARQCRALYPHVPIVLATLAQGQIGEHGAHVSIGAEVLAGVARGAFWAPSSGGA